MSCGFAAEGEKANTVTTRFSERCRGWRRRGGCGWRGTGFGRCEGEGQDKSGYVSVQSVA